MLEKWMARRIVLGGALVLAILGGAGCGTGLSIADQLGLSTGTLEVAFPLTRLDGTFTKTFTVRNTGNRAEMVTGATITSAAALGRVDPFTFVGNYPITLQPNETTTLGVQFKSPGRGVFVANVDVMYTVPDAGGSYRSSTMTMIGLGQGSTASATGDFAVDRSVGLLRCDSTAANSTKLWFSNLGSESMVVERVELSGTNAAEFRVDGGTGAFLGPGDRGFLDLVYAPRDAGPHFATLKTFARSRFQAQDASITLVGDTDPSACSFSP